MITHKKNKKKTQSLNLGFYRSYSETTYQEESSQENLEQKKLGFLQRITPFFIYLCNFLHLL